MVTAGFFALIIIIGAMLFRDYGMSWDEQTQRNYGRIVFEYVFGDGTELLTYHDRQYGPVIEFILYAAQRAAGLMESSDIYPLRHLLTYLLFVAGIGGLFLAARADKNSRLSVFVGCLFLVLSPRIFADAFYNSKDIPFLSLYLLSIYTLFKLINKPGYIQCVLHALVCAILIDTRVLGFLMPAITGVCAGFLLLDKTKDRVTALKLIKLGSVFAVILLFFVYLFWPTLWVHPVQSLLESVERMSNFPWPLSNLYRGQYISAQELPWHYIPTWIGITTPPVYLALALVGFLGTLRQLVSRESVQLKARSLALLLALLLPPLMVIGLNSTLYDGWRHLFFVYGPLLLFSVRGLQTVLDVRLQKNISRILLLCILWIDIGVQCLSILFFMFRSHPYQFTYFNMFTGGVPGAHRQFDMDYWGLSYLEGLRYVLAHDSRPRLHISVAQDVGRHSWDMLRPEERSRLIRVDDPAQADYFLTTYRWQTDPYPYDALHSIEVDGIPLLTIFKPNP